MMLLRRRQNMMSKRHLFVSVNGAMVDAPRNRLGSRSSASIAPSASRIVVVSVMSSVVPRDHVKVVVRVLCVSDSAEVGIIRSVERDELAHELGGGPACRGNVVVHERSDGVGGWIVDVRLGGDGGIAESIHCREDGLSRTRRGRVIDDSLDDHIARRI